MIASGCKAKRPPHILLLILVTEVAQGMSLSTDATQSRSVRRRALVAVVAFAGLVAGLAGIYGMGGLARNAADAACEPARETAKRLVPLSRGEVAALAVASEPKR